MKAISLWQPWASLWCSGRKRHETRHWPINHRGPLIVHAAKRFEKRFDADDPIRAILEDEFGGHWGMDLPIGALIGVVVIVDCHETIGMRFAKDDEWEDFACGDFSGGRYAWEAKNFTAFSEPIPYRGQQGIFNVSDKLLPKRTVLRFPGDPDLELTY